MVSGVSFDGLASGLETQEIMDQLMQLERRPLHNLEQEKVLQQKQREIWQDLNMDISSLDSKMNSLRQADLFQARETNSSREDMLTASADHTASGAEYRVQVEQLAGAHQVASGQFSQQLEEYIDFEGFDNGSTYFEIETGEDPVHVDVYDTDTLSSLRDRINSQQTDIEASVVDNRLVLSSSETGADNEIILGGGPHDILEQLEIWDGTFEQVLSEPQDAEFSIDGLTVYRSHNQGIDDVIEGVTLNLHDAAPGETFSLSVTHDTETAIEAVGEFVTEYNQIQDRLSELGGRGGVLEADGTLRRLQSNLRQQVMNPVETDDGEFTLLSQIGIEVDRDGTMSLDQGQLRESLGENAEDVHLLFDAREDEGGSSGVARRLDDYLSGYLRYGSGILDRKDDMYERMLRDTDNRIESVQRRIQRREESLMRQFTEMERMLSKVQSQGQWLDGQLQNLEG